MSTRRCTTRSFAGQVAVLLLVLFSGSAVAFSPKNGDTGLYERAFSRPELRVSVTLAEAESSNGLVDAPALAAFKDEFGSAWTVLVDQRSGRVNLVEGGAIPFLPGAANELPTESFGVACREAGCLSAEIVETLARKFLGDHRDLFRVDPAELVLDAAGSGAMGDSIRVIRFDWRPGGVPVVGSSVHLIVSGGNLIQIGIRNVGPLSIDPKPTLSPGSAWDVLGDYLGALAPGSGDEIVEKGALEIVQITPHGSNPDVFGGPVGEMFDGVPVWRLSFRRKGEAGLWEALVDAKSGELLKFGDATAYGRVHGGIRPSDGLPPEEDRMFPAADTGLSVPNNYTTSSGAFPGNSATTTLSGRYVHMADECGAISASTALGDLDLGSGAAGTDCTVPAGNIGGPGNTKSSRTLYYNISNMNLRAQAWNAGNPWLTGSYITCHVNLPANCNAGSSGPEIYFYRAIPGACNNLGEIPGIAMHEWGHSYDTYDGSGGLTSPVETWADWTAIQSTHLSCAGAGFFTSGNCSGYGDACTACTGIRDVDSAKHTSATPWTSANHGTVWNCGAGSYNGPCGWEDHCESGIASQALWDFVARDLVATCPGGAMCTPAGFSPLSVDGAWLLEDRLWFAGVSALTSFYTCSAAVTSGCAAGTLYSTMRALDDDGDGTANGTPHAAAIFAALSRHGIACGAAGDAANQNQRSASCPSLGITTLSATAGGSQANLSWSAVSGATRYFVYRTEATCSAGFTKIAVVNAPTVVYADTAVADGITYRYRVVAAGASDSCTGDSSNCAAVTPQPCLGSVTTFATTHSCAATVPVRVVDLTPGAGAVFVTAYSTTDSTPKTILLATVPSGSATYVGLFATTAGTAGAGEVRVSNGDTLTVKYTDPDACGAGSSVVTWTTTIDCTPPVISNVAVSAVTDRSAVVTWTTNEPSSSRVTWGSSVPPGVVADGAATLVTSHSVTITGLSACSRYSYSVTSVDAYGNSSTSTNGGSWYPISTPGRAFVLGPDDVESGVASWVATGLPGSVWHRDSCRAASGSTSWKAGRGPNACADLYGNNVETSLTWNANLVLGAAGHGFHLRWNEWYSTEYYYDTLEPQVSTDGGVSWNNAVAAYTGASGGWVFRDADLAAFTGSTVRIRFRLKTDISVVDEGWYVDDIDVSRARACGAEPVFLSVAATDSCSGSGGGGGNGLLEPGEDASLVVTLVDAGAVAATGVAATLTSATAGIFITDGSASFPDLAAQFGTGTSLPNHFSVRVDSALVCPVTASFQLKATSNEVPAGVTSTFSLPIGRAASTVTLLSEDFGGVAPPALPGGWTTSVLSGSTFVTGIGACYGTGLVYGASYVATPADSWIFSPGIALSAGVTYTLSYYQSVYFSPLPNDYAVSVGTSATPAGQTIPIEAFVGVTNTSCTSHTPTFTVPANGTYYLAWHCTSAASKQFLRLDDITLTFNQTAACAPCTPAACTPPGAPTLVSATGTCAGVALVFSPGSGSTAAYNVYRATSCGGAFTKIAGPISGTTYTDSAAPVGVAASYNVRGACDVAGLQISAASNCRTATRPTPAAPTVTGPPNNLCPATTVALSTQSGKSAYQWYAGGAPIGGATSSTYVATSAGSYSVSYTESGGCTATSTARVVSIVSCGPAVAYDPRSAPIFMLAAGCGDADGVVEPGEYWNVTIRLVNNGPTAATGVTASLAVDAGSGVAATISGNPGWFGTVPADGGTATATFGFLVSGSATCLQNLVFDVTGITSNEGGYPAAAPAFSTPVGLTPPPTIEAIPLQSSLYAGGGISTSTTFSPNPTMTSPTNVTISWTKEYAPNVGIDTTMFGPDDMTTNIGTWTASGAAWTNGPAHCSHSDGQAILTAPSASLTLTNGVSVYGCTNLKVRFDYQQSDPTNQLGVEWWTGGVWQSQQVFTGATGQFCSVDVPLPNSTWSQSYLQVRFVLTGPASQTTTIDRVSLIGDRPVGNWNANAYVEMYGPPGVWTVLKNTGAPDPSPVNVTAYYNGPGQYWLYVGENGGGFATISSAQLVLTKNQPVNCSASGCGPVPPEVAPGTLLSNAITFPSKTSMSWPAEPLATGYRVYRGTSFDLPFTLIPGLDSCLRSTGAATTVTGLADDPNAGGGLYWYLVTGTNASGEGTAGNATGQPRRLDPSGTCP